MKEFVGKTLTKKVAFMGGEVEVKVLTVGDARLIEAKSKELTSKKNKKDEDQLDLLRFVVRMTVVGAEELTDEELDGFPVSELTALSEAVMSFGQGESGND